LPVLYGPCAREKKHMELSSASAGLSGRPARDVSRLAPHEPRWTYQAFLLGEAPLSTAGGSPTPARSCLGHGKRQTRRPLWHAANARRAPCGLGRRNARAARFPAIAALPRLQERLRKTPLQRARLLGI
jgi:hypothetical protein